MEGERSGVARRRLGELFDTLHQADPSGAWLGRLVERAGGGAVEEAVAAGPLLEHVWWPERRVLDAPPSLVEWRLRQLRCPSSMEACGPTPLLPPHLVEGTVEADGFLATADAVVVVRAASASAAAGLAADDPGTVSAARSDCLRLLRAMDAARSPAGPRALLGLVVVDDDDAPTALPVWRAACARARAPDVLAEALPHRSPEERAWLAEGIVGAVSRSRVLPSAAAGDYPRNVPDPVGVRASEDP